MSHETIDIDANYKGVVAGVTNDSDKFVTMLRVDPTTKRLLVDVNGATLISDGDVVSATNDGYLVLGTDGTNYQILKTDSDGNLQVDVLSGGGGGEQYADNTAVSAAYKANLIAGTDGSNYQIIAVDASGNLQVDIVSSASIGVTGTFWQATQPVSLASMPSTPVTGTFWQTTQPVSLASVPSHAVTNAGTFAVQATLNAETTKVIGTVNIAASQTIATTNAGTFAVQESGSALTALQLIDNLAVAVDGNYLNVNCNIAGTDFVGGAGAVAAGVQRVTLASDDPAVAKLGTMDTDTSNLAAALSGNTAPVIDSYTHASINLAAGANQVLVASAANKQIWVYGVGFVVNVAGTVSFQDEDDLAITGIMPFAANSGLAIPVSGNFAMPIWKLATNKDLEVDIVTSEVDGWLDYAIVSV